jgi:hypothetical protein
VRYDGTTIFDPATATLTPQQIVNKAGTTIELGVVPANSTFTQDVTLTATVTVLPPGMILPDVVEPTGDLTFRIRNITTGVDLEPVVRRLELEDHGVKTLTLNDLPVAVYSVRVEYEGDTSFLSSVTFSDQQFIIDRTPSTTTVSSIGSIESGEEFDITATITASPTGRGGLATGTATFYDGPVAPENLLGTRPVVAGVATLRTDEVVGSGAHNITVVYSGDPNHFPSNGTAVVLVRGDTSTTVTSMLSPTGLGQIAMFTATVTPATPGAPPPTSGKVRFFIDGVERSPAGGIDVDSNGQAVFNISTLTLGLHIVTAQYEGSPGHNPSPPSAEILHRVVAFTTSLTLFKTLTTTVYGQALGVTAQLASPGRVPVGGTVQFFLDGVPMGAPVAVNAFGRANATFRGIPAGSHTINARYTGTASFGAAKGDTPHTVHRASTSTVVASTPRPSFPGQLVTFTTTVTAVAPGAFVPTGQVIFTINGVAQPPVTLNAFGRVSIQRSDLPPGTYTVTVSYLGSDNYNPSVSPPLTHIVNPPLPASRLAAMATPSPVVVGDPFTITIFARDAFNNLVTDYNEPVTVVVLATPPGGTITGNLNGVFVNGVATLGGLTVTQGGRYRVRIISGDLAAEMDIFTIGRQT